MGYDCDYFIDWLLAPIIVIVARQQSVPALLKFALPWLQHEFYFGLRNFK